MSNSNYVKILKKTVLYSFMNVAV